MFEQIIFTPHAVVKLEVLRRHGFLIEKEEVVDTVRRPDKDKNATVVTFYPARRERYES